MKNGVPNMQKQLVGENVHFCTQAYEIQGRWEESTKNSDQLNVFPWLINLNFVGEKDLNVDFTDTDRKRPACLKFAYSFFCWTK